MIVQCASPTQKDFPGPGRRSALGSI